MKRSNEIWWDSPKMEITSVEEKVSKTTEKPYMVIKARMAFRSEPRYRAYKTWSKKVYTMMCFHEPLFGLFEKGNVHMFAGELSFDWGNTWLKITKLYDDNGERLLRPQKTNCQDDAERDRLTLLQRLDEEEVGQVRERKRRLDTGWPCTLECNECEDEECAFSIPF